MTSVTASVVDRPIPDGADRTRATSDLSTTLFVEAGAGAGKTSSLVERIIGLIDDGIPVDGIAAITFTEKAAAELRHRVRRVLVDALSQDIGGEIGARRRAAFASLDHAPIGTLHSFARRILLDAPVQAGLPPGFRVLDEIESGVAFQERWETLLDRLYAEPQPAAGIVAGGSDLIALCTLDGFRLPVGGRRVAEGFHENWDLVAERVNRADPPPWQLDTTAIRQTATDLAATPCPNADKQAGSLAQLSDLVSVLSPDYGLRERLLALEAIAKLFAKTDRMGNKQNWKVKPFSEAGLLELRQRESELHDQATALLNEARDFRRRVLGTILGRFVLESAAQRAADGTIEYHDLLVLARRLVTEHVAIRRSLHDRYQRVLLDEFQDTDPIQLELAVRITADPDDPAQAQDWTTLVPQRGRLFIVGDPKQSIYRFRRADIAQYLRAAEQVHADTLHLTANFRSSDAVVHWVNHVFANVITFEPDVQPSYQPLVASRRASPNIGSVRLLGSHHHADLENARSWAEELRRREADDAADAAATALAEGWLVSDTDEAGNPITRPCRPGDITVLLPARTSLPILEAALDERGVPARAENSSVVYTTPEIRHIMLALRGAADPNDELAIVSALRSPLFGCSDVDLYQWRAAGGRWSLWATPPEGFADSPVALGLVHLANISRRSRDIPPADLIDALVDDRRVLDMALDRADARDVWRRIRYVIDQARAWNEAGGRGLRRYLVWVQLMASEARNADTILPEHDDDAVRVMTIHAAKGLEFPITIVSGMTTKPQRTSAHSVIWHRDTWTISSTAGDEIFDDFKPLDEQMSDAERRRLLYVACTRAVDHLVVSLHRRSSTSVLDPKMTSADIFVAGDATGSDSGAIAFEPTGATYSVPDPAQQQAEWSDEDEWNTRRREALRQARRPLSTSATRIAASGAAESNEYTSSRASTADATVEMDTTVDIEEVDAGLDKEPVDLDLPPWQRGRYGTAVGRAVHAVLQFADLHDGHDVDLLAHSQCAAEGILGMDATVAALARSAIASPFIQRALSSAVHRELFVATTITNDEPSTAGEERNSHDGVVVEGYVDLFVETPGGGIIVDYKTDQWPSGESRAERVAAYSRQLAVYAIALESILGHPIEGGILIRCRVDGAAEEIAIPNWDEVVASVRRQLSAIAQS